MGLNVLQQNKDGKWYCGSFHGVFILGYVKGATVDYSTGKAALKNAGAPFGKKAIAGMSQDFSDTPVIAEYNEGTDFAPQPAYMNQLPMSLWNVALEAHSGRIFIGSIAGIFYLRDGNICRMVPLVWVCH